MSDKPRIIILKESMFQSLASDAGTFAMFSGLIGIGIFLDSSAMQWVGAIMGFIVIAAKASRTAQRLTLEQARNRLDEIEKEAA